MAIPLPAGSPLLVVTGAGGLGLAIAQRLGNGRRIILADSSPTVLQAAKTILENNGHDVETIEIDVGDVQSVQKLALRVSEAAKAGRLETMVHTAAVGTTHPSAEGIYRINLFGTAYIIDSLLPLMGPGSSMVCIASVAGHNAPPISLKDEAFFAHAPTEQLVSEMNLPMHSTSLAYAYSKRANQLRVQASAMRYAEKGARINSISPGTIYSPMLRGELTAKNGELLTSVTRNSPAKRMGTAEDIANAVDFLTKPSSNYITGTDLVADGGILAAMKSSQRAHLKSQKL